MWSILITAGGGFLNGGGPSIQNECFFIHTTIEIYATVVASYS